MGVTPFISSPPLPLVLPSSSPPPAPPSSVYFADITPTQFLSHRYLLRRSVPRLRPAKEVCARSNGEEHSVARSFFRFAGNEDLDFPDVCLQRRTADSFREQRPAVSTPRRTHGGEWRRCERKDANRGNCFGRYDAAHLHTQTPRRAGRGHDLLRFRHLPRAKFLLIPSPTDR